MAKKILSFEEYAANKNLDSAEEITESCDACGEDPCVCESEEVENTEEVEDTEEVENDDESDDDDDDDEEESDDDDEDDDDDKGEETLESCSEQLKKCYEYAIKEACDYDKDDYPDHTLEGYLKENAALIAALATKTLESAHAELRDDELTIETYEAVLNSMKDAYSKKIDEMKEVWASK
jgi:hypothetical protein